MVTQPSAPAPAAAVASPAPAAVRPAAAAPAAAATIAPDQNMRAMLLDMGFAPVRADKALIATRNGSVEAALNW